MHDPDRPKFEIRWLVVGTNFHFELEQQARAFALPDSALHIDEHDVLRTRRTARPPREDDTDEFIIVPSEPPTSS